MAAAGEPLLCAVRQVVQERAMQVNRGDVSITGSTLGRDIGVLGAGVMMLELLYSPAGIGQLTRVSRATAQNASGSRAPPPVQAARREVPSAFPPTPVPRVPLSASPSTSLTEDFS